MPPKQQPKNQESQNTQIERFRNKLWEKIGRFAEKQVQKRQANIQKIIALKQKQEICVHGRHPEQYEIYETKIKELESQLKNIYDKEVEANTFQKAFDKILKQFSVFEQQNRSRKNNEKKKSQCLSTLHTMEKQAFLLTKQYQSQKYTNLLNKLIDDISRLQQKVNESDESIEEILEMSDSDNYSDDSPKQQKEENQQIQFQKDEEDEGREYHKQKKKKQKQNQIAQVGQVQNQQLKQDVRQKERQQKEKNNLKHQQQLFDMEYFQLKSEKDKLNKELKNKNEELQKFQDQFDENLKIQEAQSKQIEQFHKDQNEKKKLLEQYATEQNCIICFEQKREFLVIPCGHLIYCEKCKNQAKKKCPTCRGPCEQIMRVYT